MDHDSEETQHKHTKIEGIVLVSCIVCERLMQKNPFLKMNDAYPATWISNLPTMHGKFVAAPCQAYLCKEHMEAYA